MFHPYYYYCNLIWGNANQTIMMKLFTSQKRIVKSLFSKSFHISALNTNIFNDNNILSIFEINSYKICIVLIFKIINNKLIIYDPHLLQTLKISSDSSYPTRTLTDNLIKPLLIKNKLSNRNICYDGPQYWNKLPSYFKKSIKQL